MKRTLHLHALVRQRLLPAILLVAVLVAPAVDAFLPLGTTTATRELVLHAKKKSTRANRGQGFGKGSTQDRADASASVDASSSPPSPSASAMPAVPKGAVLQSIEPEAGGATTTSTTPPMFEETTTTASTPEERTKQILREQYGMQTLDEQQAAATQRQSLKEQRKRLEELKRKAELDQDVDIIAMIPAPILKGLDTFLKAGVAISGTAFLLAGVAITAEAWSKASGQSLPPNVDNFIVQYVEPNFTPGLLVVLGFSISLGVLAAASLGSEGAQYREK